MLDMKSKRRIGALTFFIVALTALNYGAQEWSHSNRFDYFDTVFQRLYFLPIILGSFWFALRGGLIVFLVTAASLVPYLVLRWQGASASDLNRLMLIGAYLLMAVVLGQAVARERREHRRARESETLAAIGNSMSAIAHEMRTPLIAIGGFTRMVRKKLAEGSPESEKLDIVMVETLRLEYLLTSVLDFARPLALDRASVPVGRVIRECMAVTGLTAEQHGITLKLRLQPDLPPASLDEMRMKQVLINLITNAIQASPRGESVTVRCHSRHGGLIIEIIDCGCGIPANKRKDVFSPFFSTKKEGMGLGLPIVKKIVEAHDGTMQIVDNRNRGLIFRIEIPDCLEKPFFNAEIPSAAGHRDLHETIEEEEVMSQDEKIAAVRMYLSEEFARGTIEDVHDEVKKARVFRIKADGRNATAIVKDEFLEKHSAGDIPGKLRTALLAEHLRECNFPIVVTGAGTLSD